MRLISIIMPCHNGAKYISSAIDSVLAQTYSEWELLVINDHSTDNSVEIIQSYCQKDSRIKFFDNPENKKMPATTRNVGIKNASGSIIAFLDCDDMWLPNKLENQVKLFEVKECAIVFSYYKKMDDDGTVHAKVVHSRKRVSYRRLLNGCCIGNLTGMYDVDKVGKVYQQEVHSEDYVMWLEILKRGYVALNTSTVEAYYRKSAGSLTGTKLRVVSWTWNVYRKVLKMPLIVAGYHFFVYCVKGLIKYFK